ncbi:MAG: phenylalanine 4-monooxygenase [Bdellovibrionales bacterium RIFCSPHIGHO2_01_FULL_40_29]|nr:MAG: phenylalanine 4-monooxygenase [Bdellovibrionales bacterium RIFCSPHIGHO2_01_FULL_40_29]OFZ35111.1 MAG: phenylalanine 4-monooxygenase [Bdellovibrionales bacterium RIFCSPHIGHO2_02_FULL_40_15]
MVNLPHHLQKYIVKQNYEKYTALDHAVWRYVLRQLKSFLKIHAHECYLDGLEKTGIDIDKIPKIDAISEKLEKFGWRALPVSGFIPPAAFMELQSLGVLPIASDMRSIDHLLYTPAPDIVHEAAGHAPILIHPEYANYLRQYAQVAKKAILSKQDLEQYEAIRVLSDLKENPNSTEAEIKSAESQLEQVTRRISFISEASELSRMNWWTAEYGLIGEMNNPKIFGAGLLSSVGESRWCLSKRVRKVPLTVDCIKQSYDITEPQPQLFVAKDFKNLVDVLESMAQTMAFKVGGVSGLDKAIKAESVNTVQLDSGIQISGVLSKYHLSGQTIAYLQFTGPTQISFQDKELTGHDKNYHQHGYGSPLGELVDQDWANLSVDQKYSLIYKSGVKIEGTVTQVKSISDNAKIITFKNATAKFNDQILFQPDWGLYDVITGHVVTSVFGGPADRVAYGETDDFIAKTVPPPIYTESQKNLFSLYQSVRNLRDNPTQIKDSFLSLYEKVKANAPTEWLLFLELLEICNTQNIVPEIEAELLARLLNLKNQNDKVAGLIEDGLSLSHEIN